MEVLRKKKYLNNQKTFSLSEEVILQSKVKWVRKYKTSQLNQEKYCKIVLSYCPSWSVKSKKRLQLINEEDTFLQ